MICPTCKAETPEGASLCPNCKRMLKVELPEIPLSPSGGEADSYRLKVVIVSGDDGSKPTISVLATRNDDGIPDASIRVDWGNGPSRVYRTNRNGYKEIVLRLGKKKNVEVSFVLLAGRHHISCTVRLSNRQAVSK